jgi:hypothetical protein
MLDCAWILGRQEGMEPVVAEVVSRFQRVRALDDLAALETLAGESPDLILVCQHWPDEFSRRDVERLLATFPLARFLCCYGPWCASDGRRRDIWPAAMRVPLDQALSRLRKEQEVIVGRRPPLPWTAGTEEIFAFDAAD